MSPDSTANDEAKVQLVVKPNRATRRGWLKGYKLHGDLCRQTRGAKAYLRTLNLACNKGRIVRAN